MSKKQFSQIFPSSLGCICCLIVWRPCKFGTNSNLIFIMILMNIIVYGTKCTQSAIITHIFSLDVGLFGILEMIKLFPTLIFIFGIFLIKLTFSSIHQGFWSSSLIHASRFVFLAPPPYNVIKVDIDCSSIGSPERSGFGGLTRKVVELLILWQIVVILLKLMLNFVIFLTDWNLLGILDLETSFASQILKQFWLLARTEFHLLTNLLLL